MRQSFAVLAAVLLLALPARAADEAKLATLTANGEGVVQVVPDIVVVSLGVVSRAKTAAAALASNSADMQTIVDWLKQAGIDEKDLGTSGFSVSPLYPPARDDGTVEQRIVGYEVSNQLRVTIRDMGKAGDLLDKVVSAGSNQIGGIAFDISDRVKPGEEALKLAIADARRKAEIMAEAAGVKLVRIVAVSGGEGGGYYPVAAAPMARMEKAVPVMPGQQAISSNATIVWEIAPK